MALKPYLFIFVLRSNVHKKDPPFLGPIQWSLNIYKNRPLTFFFQHLVNLQQTSHLTCLAVVKPHFHVPIKYKRKTYISSNVNCAFPCETGSHKVVSHLVNVQSNTPICVMSLTVVLFYGNKKKKYSFIFQFLDVNF